eukprot:c20286_g1_i1.p1 GENE.c20286_g1_i1~~c20286_g1_i1.p1  ORF type:complete len:617 (-),score=264.97 c20286_g1_i1:33-1883(-)
MIYDEGFEIRIDDYKYFAFSHYHTNPNNQGENINDCDRTFVGWYHANNNTNWGCYYGIKEGAAPLNNPVPLSARGPQRQLSQEEKWAKHVDYDHVNEEDALDDNSKLDPKNVQSFLELINNSQSSFKVKFHNDFHDKSFNHLRRIAGSFLATETEMRPMASTTKNYNANFNVSELPKSWDWRNVNGENYDSPFKYQGFCGSCYSMATVQMFETRIRVMSNNTHRPIISTQDAVSCSRYNQGCDGGYPYLVSKYAQDFGIVLEDCFPYTPGSECGSKCANPDSKIFVSDYYYVGGYYGACSEAAMMQELYENGPFVVSFNAGSDFMFYSGGVYVTTQFSDSFLQISQTTGQVKKKEWEKTTHSVLLVGYGETKEDGKYWIAKNTWGEQWGEHGYFRIKRGTDESSFESMSLAANPILTYVSPSAESASRQAPLLPPPTTSKNSQNDWADSNLLEENEGATHQTEDRVMENEVKVGNPQIQGLEAELSSFRDPEFEKTYTSLRRPAMTNDYGAPLKAPSDDDDDNTELKRNDESDKKSHKENHHHHQNAKHHKEHGHHSSHHHHDDESNNHDHTHHRHSTSHHTSTKLQPKSNKNNLIINNLQVDEGVEDEFADPGDE